MSCRAQSGAWKQLGENIQNNAIDKKYQITLLKSAHSTYKQQQNGRGETNTHTHTQRKQTAE